MGASFRNTGDIVELAGCDLLLSLLSSSASFQAAEGTLERKLDPANKDRSLKIEKLTIDKATFDNMHAADRMADETEEHRRLLEGASSKRRWQSASPRSRAPQASRSRKYLSTKQERPRCARAFLCHVFISDETWDRREAELSLRHRQPSTPCTYFESSDARRAHRLHQSASASPLHAPTGPLPAINFSPRPEAPSVRFPSRFQIGVLVAPGATTFTRMPRGESSAVRTRAIA